MTDRHDDKEGELVDAVADQLFGDWRTEAPKIHDQVREVAREVIALVRDFAPSATQPAPTCWRCGLPMLEGRMCSGSGYSLTCAPSASVTHWEEEARRYAQNADFWREKYESTLSATQRTYDDERSRQTWAVPMGLDTIDAGIPPVTLPPITAAELDRQADSLMYALKNRILVTHDSILALAMNVKRAAERIKGLESAPPASGFTPIQSMTEGDRAAPASQTRDALRAMYAAIGECIANPDARIDLDYWHQRLEPLVLPGKSVAPASRGSCCGDWDSVAGKCADCPVLGSTGPDVPAIEPSESSGATAKQEKP